jgi:hypothetical protein
MENFIKIDEYKYFHFVGSLCDWGGEIAEFQKSEMDVRLTSRDPVVSGTDH